MRNGAQRGGKLMFSEEELFQVTILKKVLFFVCMLSAY